MNHLALRATARTSLLELFAQLIAFATLAGTLTVAPVYAQNSSPQPADSTSARPLETTFDAEFLRELPTSDNLFNVVDTLQPSIVSDHFSGGGLSVGQPARLGGFLSSPSQTLFTIDGVPVSDPTGNGAPLLIPELALWDRIRVGTGLFGAGTNATGLAIDLRPIAPTERWTRSVEGSISHGGLTGAAPGGSVPAIVRLDGWDRAAIAAAGPLMRDRLAAVFVGSWTRASEFTRSDSFAVDSSAGSLFSHLVFTPNNRDSIRLVGWVQERHIPLAERAILSQAQATTTDTAGHAQAVWEHGGAFGHPWRAYASYTGRHEESDFTPTASGVTERLVDGPVAGFAALSNNTVQSWKIGARLDPRYVLRGREHVLTAGADATGGRIESSSFFSGTIGELVHGSPARVWVFHDPGGVSLRHGIESGLFVGDAITVASQVRLEAGLRLQSSVGQADGGSSNVAWHTLLPRVVARWDGGDPWHLIAFAGYSRSADRLTLDELAIGDPGAPTADVFRWNALAGPAPPLTARGPLVARAGPGTGGSPALNAIDPNLRAPTMDEIAIGVEARPVASLLVRFTGVTRRQHEALGVVNVGAPASSAYTSFTVSDPGSNVLDTADDTTLTVFNRLPSSYGLDRYLLTNTTQPDATFRGIGIDLQFKHGPLMISGGATAGRAEASAASRGFGPLENDQAILGELFANPNAEALAYGRPFTDRAYTAKFASTYRFPADVRLGVVARYQDGQPFARVLVFPGLNQGAEAVRAFTNGESRFMFVGTLDMRLQKGFVIGDRRIDAFVDVYNLAGLSNSVEEDIAAPPDVRIATAVQPPRAFHVGLRLAF